jgi:membrane protein implicated in regulation of membrane protease activity
MKNPALFFGGIILVILGIALGVFFLIPGINHIITTSQTHVKHAIACFALAVLGILVALVNRPQAG